MGDADAPNGVARVTCEVKDGRFVLRDGEDEASLTPAMARLIRHDMRIADRLAAFARGQNGAG